MELSEPENRTEQLPFWPSQLLEQANPIVRSGVFSVTNRPRYFTEYTPMKMTGKGVIEFTGPQLTIQHEDVWMQLLIYLRGQRITQPLNLHLNQLLCDLRKGSSGAEYKRLVKRLEDLGKAKMRISCPHLLKNLLNLLEQLQQSNSKSKLALVLDELYGQYVIDIKSALANDDEYMLTLGFINHMGKNSRTRQATISLDPLIILMFDGVNTTLISRRAREEIASPISIKLMSFIESHSQEIHPMLLRTYHEISGSNADFEKCSRKIKADYEKSLSELEAAGYIHTGWSFYKNKEGEWGIRGVLGTKKLKAEYYHAKQAVDEAF